MRIALATAAASATLAVVLPAAAAAPATDDAGFVNSTARCSAPDTAVLFGSTTSSRIAICKTLDGHYEYRGVRVSDGAKLIVPAEGSGNDSFVAQNAATSYLVTPKSLVVSEGNRVIREEPMVDFHSPQAPAPTSATPTSTTPLPPPLPAERGHGS